jgi:linoleoyl-CoA desaturase
MQILTFTKLTNRMTNNTVQTALKFSQKIGKEFDGTLKKRVRDYFKDKNISKHANFSMVLKTVVMISLYIIPYVLMITGLVTNGWLIAAMWLIMGIAMAGIGMSVMHDANHGAYSKSEKTNRFIGRIIGLVGGFAANWKIQHNILHHSYTNIHGHDEDISAPMGLMRFSPNSELKKTHRFQHWYAWFFYGLMTLSWMVNKDFEQIYRYKKMGLTETQNKKFYKLMIELILNKIFYYALIVVLPIIFIDMAWWATLLFVFMMHFTASIILSVVFQLAHIVPETQFPLAELDHTIENNWSIHQLQTTSNFAPKNRLLSWFVGGLNYQVEHHLFPNICHVHYKKLSAIVQKTAEEFGVPYYSEPTFFGALVSHVRMLKQLGRA